MLYQLHHRHKTPASSTGEVSLVRNVTTTPLKVQISSSENLVSSRHCTDSRSRNLPFGVTLNFCPFGCSNPASTARMISGATKSCPTSLMTGNSRPSPSHAVTEIWLTKYGRKYQTASVSSAFTARISSHQ